MEIGIVRIGIDIGVALLRQIEICGCIDGTGTTAGRKMSTGTVMNAGAHIIGTDHPERIAVKGQMTAPGDDGSYRTQSRAVVLRTGVEVLSATAVDDTVTDPNPRHALACAHPKGGGVDGLSATKILRLMSLVRLITRPLHSPAEPRLPDAI